MVYKPKFGFDSRRSGFVAVWIVLSLSVIIGVVAINLDGGRLMEQRRLTQTAADAAALAAGQKLYESYWQYHGLDPLGAAQAAALDLAAANGIPASAVTVNIPPRSGTFAGKAGYVEVLIQTELEASFGQLFTSSSLPVNVRSVSSGLPMNLGIVLLQPSGPAAFLNKALAFTLLNAPLVVNSSDPAAFTQQSFGVVLASRLDVTGNFINPGGALMMSDINTGVSPIQDPLQFLPIPQPSSLPTISTSAQTINAVLPVILQPGVYQGGLHITGLSTVVMSPGIYIMQGGGFQVDEAATVAGLGVMIYNGTSSSYAAGPISVSGQGKVVLTAPVSGVYQGINFFQDRALTNPVSITGLGLTTITGTIYAAQAAINLTDSVAVGLDILGGAYVAQSMSVSGVGGIEINLGLNPPRIPNVQIVE